MQTSVISAYVIGAAVLIAALLLAVIVSNCIKYEPGANPQDAKKRRLWFWIFCVSCLVFSFLIPYFIIYTGIKVPAKQAAYLMHMVISTGVMTVLYIVIGWILSKVSGHGKLSNWF